MTLRTIPTFLIIVLLLPLSGYSQYDAKVSKAYMKREMSDDTEVEKKISRLLKAMTIEEKAGQLTQITHSSLLDYSIRTEDGSPGDAFSLDTAKVERLIKEFHIGTFLNGIAVSQEVWYAYSHAIQRINLRNDRHGIPIIYGMDHMHGANYVDNSTIFPHSINIGATFQPEFSRKEAEVVSIESVDLGHHWNFAPVLDVGRDPRFPRYYETYGEDPYLCSVMGKVYIEALQANEAILPQKQAATAKHFLGYSEPKSGWDRAPSQISDQYLQEVFIPPFQAAVDAGVKTFMINGGEINGVPVHASHKLLTKVLRDQLGFRGVVVSDWEDVIRLFKTHRVAETEKEAAYLALMAGLDISMTPYTTDFATHVVELVQEGRIPEERLDLSLARVLRLKFDLGLFERPYPRKDRFDRLKTEEHLAMARDAARESMVLMRNEGILPLDPKNTQKLVIAGPTANVKRVLSGGWTLRWIPGQDDIFPDDMHTVLSAMQNHFPSTRMEYADDGNILRASAGADAILICAGEFPYSEGSGNIYDHELPEGQQDLIRQAQQTGLPVILVMIAGRPRGMSKVYRGCDAVIWAGLPGFEGAEAIAEVLNGTVNPSGKLPFSYPTGDGHFYTYDHKLMDKNHFAGLSDERTIMAPFGHGLSYTSFTYSNLQLSDTVLRKSGELTVSVDVKNTGDRRGKEAVLWYIQDEVGSITRPLQQLKYFEKKELDAGEKMRFTFRILPERDLGFPNGEGELQLEAGFFKIMTGGLVKRFKLLP
ncbi:MAG: glycoside hydrolase family 3 N-terminal domain-containing protein [Bacteroidota bacterium]